MNDLFVSRFKEYFKEHYDTYLDCLKEECTKALFINENKTKGNDLNDVIDFPVVKSSFNESSYYYTLDNIGHHKAYELGLIYPQEPSAAFTASFPCVDNVKFCVDMCASPGGKSINILNRLNEDAILVSNEINYKRATILSQNLERSGLCHNVIVTNKNGNDLEKQFFNMCDLVILDAPCSGEGMVRRFPEIIEDYSLEKISECARMQYDLLENAYGMLKQGGQLLYSTCTYAPEEDEDQILSFLNRHNDMELMELPFDGINISSLKGTIKLSPLNNTEGQFISLLRRKGDLSSSSFKPQKTCKNKLVEDFIKKNLSIDDYRLYCLNEDAYYLSISDLPKIDRNVLRYGIELGKITNNRFEPSHSLYRCNTLRDKFLNVHDLDEDEYRLYISGLELPLEKPNGYYLLTHKGYSVGYGKCAGNRMKNKYPKGLRQML